MRNVGVIVILVGVGVALLGGLIALGWLGWFGRLPGDIRIATESTRVFIPITSMLIVSVVVTIVVNVIRSLFF